MASLAERVVIVVMMLSALEASYGAVYKVGDSAGWTIIGNIDYRSWAAPKSFQVGDTIIFEYNAQFHNVMRVTHAMYRACNASVPLAAYTTGNDSITITNHGHHFFICGAPGHCQAGQKVDINVLKVNASSSSSSSSSSSAAAAPSPSSAMATPVPDSSTTEDATAPAPNNSVPLKSSFTIMGLVAVILAFCSF